VWTEGLAQAGFPCPTPVRTQNGELIVTLDDGQMATAVSWINAVPICDMEATESLYFDLGRLLANLHRTTDQLAPKIARPSWDVEALLGDNPGWGRFWENPALTPSEVEAVLTTREDAAQHLLGLDGLDMGLIHADALQENVLMDGDLYLIDFDDSGYGYRQFDLGVALIQHEESENLPSLTKAICDGYGTNSEHMPLFIMLRSMASAGWVMSRADPNAPPQRRYADRMLRCIENYRRR
jgi:Ser/Thr protein kinase RdoA (MazF antagonist)